MGIQENNKCKRSVMKVSKNVSKNVSKEPEAKFRKRVSFQSDANTGSVEFHGKRLHLSCGAFFKDWISGTHKLSGSRISIKIIPKSRLRDAKLDANFTDAKLDANFRDAEIEDANFRDAENKDSRMGGTKNENSRIGDAMNNEDANRDANCVRDANLNGDANKEWKRVMNERKIWQTLSHLNHVVPLINFINAKNNYYFITPSIENHISLDQVMHNHTPLPLLASKIISGQLASIIDKIHSLGIILRNLSCASILIDKKIGLVRLINFRDAKQTPASRSVIYESDDEYKSPEMIKCKSYTDATDWWSFGIILLQLLSGSTPLFLYKENSSITSDMDSSDILLRGETFPAHALIIFIYLFFFVDFLIFGTFFDFFFLFQYFSAIDLIPEMVTKVPENAQNLLQGLLQTVSVLTVPVMNLSFLSRFFLISRFFSNLIPTKEKKREKD